MTSVDGFLPLVKEKWERHSKASAYREDPVLWMKEVAGFTPWRAQREIAYSVRDNRATAVAAAHSVGKTFLTGYLACWWIDVHPVDEVFIASTAPSQDQVSLLWDVIRLAYAQIQDRYEKGLIDHALPGYITGDNIWKLKDGRKIGQGRKPPDNKSDVAFQGRHAPYLLAIADEAVGVPAGFIEALGNIATGVNNRQLLIANPTDPTCYMAKIWKDNNPEWVRMHISVFDSPTMVPEEGFDAQKMIDGGAAGPEYVKQKLQEYGGEDDPRYISRVTGQWAFDAGNNLFTEEELAKGRNCYVLPDPARRPMMGLDIARKGKDASVLYRAEWGEVWETDPETNKPVKPSGRTGLKLRRVDSWKNAPLTGGKADNPGTTERAHEYMLAEGAEFLKYDASGMGQAIMDGLAVLNDYQQNRHGYIWFEVYGQSTRGVDRRQYENARAEQYFNLKNMLYAGTLDISHEDEELQEDLRGVVFEYATQGRIKIESKDDMKRRGVKSPDFADAAWYACYDVTPLLDPLMNAKHVELETYNEFEEHGWGGFNVISSF